jgi:hypothetical protein
MRFSTLNLLALLGASMTAAVPTELTNFLLVTTDQPEPNYNSSNLKAVSATSLFVRLIPSSIPSLSSPIFFIFKRVYSDTLFEFHVSAYLWYTQDPYYQPALVLRLIGPGYGSLPNFTLSNNTLHTTASGPHGIGIYQYNSTTVAAGVELQVCSFPSPISPTALPFLVNDLEGSANCDGVLVPGRRATARKPGVERWVSADGGWGEGGMDDM